MNINFKLKHDQEQLLLYFLRKRYNSKENISKLLNAFILEFIQINKQTIKEFDSVDKFDSSEIMFAYLNSEHWQELSRITLARDRNRCYTCGAIHDIDVYHVTFERLFDEHYDDLVTLCLKCKREMEVFKSERSCSLKKAFGMLCKRHGKRILK